MQRAPPVVLCSAKTTKNIAGVHRDNRRVHVTYGEVSVGRKSFFQADVCQALGREDTQLAALMSFRAILPARTLKSGKHPAVPWNTQAQKRSK